REIKRGGRIFIGSGGAKPEALVNALIVNANHFSDNEITHLLTLGEAEYVDKAYSDSFRHNAFFIGANVRKGVIDGLADYTPIFLSEIPALFRKGGMPVEAALIMVSPPDKYGYCSFGINIDIVKSATAQARLVIAEINPNMPVTYGDTYIHISEIDYITQSANQLKEHILPGIDPVSDMIGRYVSQLIDDGVTLQMGIGVIPNAVLRYLTEKRNLGVHTEMFSDGVVDLVESGVIDNRKKTFHNGKLITSFCLGSKKVYNFVDKNPAVEFHPSDYVNNPVNIARNDKMVAINSALEVDLTGQVCADSIGTIFYSGIGGQVDFIRGAAMSKGGKPIIALPSTAKGGKLSRIVPQLSQGAGVVTTRGDVHYIVTEYGIAYLHGKSVRQRAMELAQISHPDFQSELLEYLKEKKYVFADQKLSDQMRNLIPGQYESSLVLGEGGHEGGHIRVRPVFPTDERLVQDFFYSHTVETIYNRYFHIEKSMHHDRAHSMVNLNFRRDIALLCLFGDHENQKAVGIGRYSLNPTNNSAEVAFVVHEEFRGNGIGEHLLSNLIEIGRERGVHQFT
ncbi:MAG: GNAT family N-acetyltransferase, partial [Nitrospinota bacterium]